MNNIKSIQPCNWFGKRWSYSQQPAHGRSVGQHVRHHDGRVPGLWAGLVPAAGDGEAKPHLGVLASKESKKTKKKKRRRRKKEDIWRGVIADEFFERVKEKKKGG